MEPTNELVTTPMETPSTQSAPQPVEAKKDEPVVDTQNIQKETFNESPLEGAGTSVPTPDSNVTPTENKNPVEGKLEVSDEIQKKLDRLAEYEVKDKELSDLRKRLGVKDQVPDNQIFSAQQQLGIVENQAQQEYIALCNQYGVDYRPDKIDESGRELLEKNPQAFYELRYKLEGLNNRVEQKRQEVNTFIEQRDISSAIARNQQIIQASPALGNIINYYLQQGSITGADIDTISNMGRAMLSEAFEMGRQSVMTEKAQVKPAEVLNNTTISQQAPSTPVVSTGSITLADVEKMDAATYKAHEKEIDQLFLR